MIEDYDGDLWSNSVSTRAVMREIDERHNDLLSALSSKARSGTLEEIRHLSGQIECLHWAKELIKRKGVRQK
jgi:hypothetical protein